MGGTCHDVIVFTCNPLLILFQLSQEQHLCLQISTFRTRQQALPICERLRLRLLRLPGRKDTRQQSHDSHTPCCYGNKMLAILYGLLREDKKTTVTCQIISHSANNVATATHNTNKRVCTAIVDITEFMTDNSTVLRSR